MEKDEKEIKDTWIYGGDETAKETANQEPKAEVESEEMKTEEATDNFAETEEFAEEEIHKEESEPEEDGDDEEEYEYDEEELDYKNKFEYTYDLLKELYSSVIKWDKFRKINTIFLYCVLAVNVVVDIVFVVIGETSLLPLLIVSAILLGALAVFKTMEPKMLAKNTINGYKKRVSETMACETTFADDEFTMMDVATNQGKHYTYDLITHVRETESFIVLNLGKRELIPVYKKGFTKGELESFRPYILDRVDDVVRGR